MPMLAVRRSKWLLIPAVLALIAVASLANLASAAPNPPGNNGTIKVDDTPFDDAPDNEPHVGCSFQVDLYGYDEGDLDATVRFEAHPPTGARQVLLTDTVFIGEDDNSGGGSEAGLDASETYTLDVGGIEPHPNQGVHVKLTIHAEGSQGADVKHKVFWVTGCPPAPTTTTIAPTTTAAPTTTVCPTTTTAPSSTAAPSSTVGETTTTKAEETTTTAAPSSTVGETTSTTAAPTTTTAAPTTTVGETTTTAAPTTTTAAPTTTVGETTTTKAEETTTTTTTTTNAEEPTSSSTHDTKSEALAAAGETTTTSQQGATTTEPPTTIPTSTSEATSTTACPGDSSLNLANDVGPSDSPGLLPLAASGVAVLSIAATSLLGLRRRRLL
jgi:hypothetical protein